ncbi:hypothetical protein FRB91_001218 [Serendipita sp. 411]|nr:hypothetical protein FRB91_001218 [Serendipita sp. 411]
MPVSRVAASAPPPAPSDPLRHPYHLLKLVLGTLRPSSVSLGQHSALSPTGTRAQGLGGGFLTPRLYVPSIIWYQPELWTLIMDLPEKARQLEVLREALRTVHETSIVLFGRVMFSAGTQGGPMNLSASGTKISRTRSREQSQHGHSSSVHSINSSPAAAPLGFDDPIAWLNALEKLSNSLAEMQTSSSKKLGLGDPNAASKKTTETGAGYSTINGNSNSVTKKMMDWSTRVAKKAVGGGKGPSGELMDWYSDALGGVCALSAMLDGHLCALKNALPASMATTPGVGTQPTNTSSRRPTTSKGSGYETIGFGRMVSSSSLSSSQTAISSSSSNLTASSSASTLFNIPHPLPNLNNPLPPLPPLEQQGKSDVDYFSSPYAPASQSKPTLNRTNVDPLDEVVSQLVSKYTSFPKFVNTQALMHLEKITRIFATFVCPLVLRDVAVLIQGLRTRTTADGGEWMGATL